MVEVVAEEILGRDYVTQELAPPEVTSEVQNVQCGTSGDKVWTKLPQNFINLDSDKEEHPEEEEILKLTEEISIPEDISKEVERSGGEISGRDGFPR